MNNLQGPGGNFFAGCRFKAVNKGVKISKNIVSFLLIQLHARASWKMRVFIAIFNSYRQTDLKTLAFLNFCVMFVAAAGFYV